MRIVKLSVLSFLGLVALLAVWIYVDAAWRSYTNYKRDMKSYMGLDIGASREEAMYVFGYPNYVLGEKVYDPDLEGEWQRLLDTSGNDPKNAIPADKTIDDYNGWSFEKSGYRIDVDFDAKTQTVESIACFKGDGEGHCPGLFGIYTGDDEDSVVGELGKADLEKYDGTSKTYRWPGVGVDCSPSAPMAQI